MAKVLGIGHEGVSRLEKRSDVLLLTLSKSVEVGTCPQLPNSLNPSALNSKWLSPPLNNRLSEKVVNRNEEKYS